MTRDRKEYIREYHRRYRAEHLDEMRMANREYRRRKAAERGPITATCVVCGKTFVKTGHFQVCCSAECARLRKNELGRRASRPSRSSRTPHTSVCQVCGKTFAAKTSRAKFCSRTCHHTFFNGQRKRPLVTKTCPVCGKVFETARKEKVYCSNRCYKAAHYTPVKPHDLVCVFCGKAFTSMNSTAKYCSRLCAGRRRTGYETLADFENAQAARKASSFEKRSERDRNGLTLAQIQEVINAQDGDPSQLWKRSQSWTKAQRKYAQKRYEENHGLFTSTYNP
mgnify:CR=1 FL=1